MTGKTRGDVTIKLGGQSYVMRPTYEAIDEIEEALGMGFIEFLMRLQEGRCRMRELVAIIRAGITAAGQEPPGDSEIGNLIVAQDAGAAYKAVGQFCAGAFPQEKTGKKPKTGQARRG